MQQVESAPMNINHIDTRDLFIENRFRLFSDLSKSSDLRAGDDDALVLLEKGLESAF